MKEEEIKEKLKDFIKQSRKEGKKAISWEAGTGDRITNYFIIMCNKDGIKTDIDEELIVIKQGTFWKLAKDWKGKESPKSP